jgi:hypothetical protein
MRLAALILAFVGSAAFAQSGSTDFAYWVTERVGGKATTTIYPAPGRPGLPITHVRPDAIGGIGRTFAGDASHVLFSKPVSVPFTSAYSGGTQALGATVARTATKAAVIDSAIMATKVANPVGWVILGAGILGAYFDYDPGSQRLLTLLKPEIEQQGSTEPAQMVTKYRATNIFGVPVPPGYHDTAAEACQVSFAALRAEGYMDGYSHYDVHQGWICRASNGGSPTQYGTAPDYLVPGCPNGGELQGDVCVIPGGSGCPSGYQYTLDFFYGGFECRPMPGTTPTLMVPPDAMVAAAFDQEIGTNPAKLEQLLNDMPGDGPGIEAPLSAPAASGPSSLPGSTTTTNLNDGGRIETQLQHPITYVNNTINIYEQITNTTYNSNNEVINQTTTDGPGQASFPDDYATRDRQCGYPGGPACKIDETGTPTDGDLTQAVTSRDDGFAQLEALPGDVLGSPPSTDWGLSFGFPVGCTNPPPLVMAFAGGRSLEADLCQHETAIHGVMSFIWLLLTAVGCVAMVRQTAG